MDKKAGYIITIGLVIVAALFFATVSHHSGHKSEDHPGIVKQELESPEEVPGVFRNVYVSRKPEAHEEEVAHEEISEEPEEHSTSHTEAQKAPEEQEAKPTEEGVILMENPEYKKHKKPIVKFTHLKHIEKYQITCGQCHHDDAGEPLNDISMEDEVESCMACHSTPGLKPKKKGQPKPTLAEKLEYHGEALHANCITCHKNFNKKTGKKSAPTSCTKCHSKKK